MKTSAFADAVLELILNGVPIPNIADDAVIDPLTEIYISLHTASPGTGGTQSTNACTYPGYTRIGMVRDGTGWNITDGVAMPVADIIFPEATADDESATHMGIGTAAAGEGTLLYSGGLSAPITITANSSPTLRDTTTVTEG